MNNQHSRKTGKLVKRLEYPSFNATTTLCRISGFPIMQDNYFPNETLLVSRHPIFDQNAFYIVKLAIKATTYHQRSLTQLAILNYMNCLKLSAPVTLPQRVVQVNHYRIVDMFLVWLGKPSKYRRQFIGGTALPQFSSHTIKDSSWVGYEEYLNLLFDEFDFQNDLPIKENIEIILDNVDSYPSFKDQLADELATYKNKRRKVFSPELARFVLEALAEVDNNRDTILANLREYIAFLTNPGYKSIEGYTRVYKDILHAIMPQNNYNLHHNIKIVLDHLAAKIRLLLDEEAGFFGQRKFKSTSGEIVDQQGYSLIVDEAEIEALTEKEIKKYRLFDDDTEIEEEILNRVTLKVAKPTNQKVVKKKVKLSIKAK